MSVKRKRPVWIYPVVVGIFAVLVFVAWGVGQLLANVDAAPAADARPSSQEPAAVAPGVDVSDLPAFWDLQYSKADWYGLTSMPVWDGNVLTAKTTFYADADAVDPAKRICIAMSMYWLQSKSGEFHSVRVLDGAGQILVSRHTQSDQCTWRR